jgi:hypothetical protein
MCTQLRCDGNVAPQLPRTGGRFAAVQVVPGMRSALHRTVFLLIITTATSVTAAPAAAQTATATLSADLSPRAKLSVSSSSLTFPDTNPDTVPQVPASSGAVTITAKGRATEGSTVTLTVQASADLRSGVSTIPASALTWTAAGPGFVNGTLSTTAAAVVGSWTGSGVRVGTQHYVFQNLWTYVSGTYTTSLLYTLTSP